MAGRPRGRSSTLALNSYGSSCRACAPGSFLIFPVPVSARRSSSTDTLVVTPGMLLLPPPDGLTTVVPPVVPVVPGAVLPVAPPDVEVLPLPAWVLPPWNEPLPLANMSGRFDWVLAFVLVVLALLFLFLSLFFFWEFLPDLLDLPLPSDFPELLLLSTELLLEEWWWCLETFSGCAAALLLLELTLLLLLPCAWLLADSTLFCALLRFLSLTISCLLSAPCLELEFLVRLIFILRLECSPLLLLATAELDLEEPPPPAPPAEDMLVLAAGCVILAPAGWAGETFCTCGCAPVVAGATGVVAGCCFGCCDNCCSAPTPKALLPCCVAVLCVNDVTAGVTLATVEALDTAPVAKLPPASRKALCNDGNAVDKSQLLDEEPLPIEVLSDFSSATNSLLRTDTASGLLFSASGLTLADDLSMSASRSITRLPTPTSHSASDSASFASLKPPPLAGDAVLLRDAARSLLGRLLLSLYLGLFLPNTFFPRKILGLCLTARFTSVLLLLRRDVEFTFTSLGARFGVVTSALLGLVAKDVTSLLRWRAAPCLLDVGCSFIGEEALWRHMCATYDISNRGAT